MRRMSAGGQIRKELQTSANFLAWFATHSEFEEVLNHVKRYSSLDETVSIAKEYFFESTELFRKNLEFDSEKDERTGVEFRTSLYWSEVLSSFIVADQKSANLREKIERTLNVSPSSTRTFNLFDILFLFKTMAIIQCYISCKPSSTRMQLSSNKAWMLKRVYSAYQLINRKSGLQGMIVEGKTPNKEQIVLVSGFLQRIVLQFMDLSEHLLAYFGLNAHLIKFHTHSRHTIWSVHLDLISSCIYLSSCFRTLGMLENSVCVLATGRIVQLKLHLQEENQISRRFLIVQLFHSLADIQFLLKNYPNSLLICKMMIKMMFKQRVFSTPSSIVQIWILMCRNYLKLRKYSKFMSCSAKCIAFARKNIGQYKTEVSELCVNLGIRALLNGLHKKSGKFWVIATEIWNKQKRDGTYHLDISRMALMEVFVLVQKGDYKRAKELASNFVQTIENSIIPLKIDVFETIDCEIDNEITEFLENIDMTNETVLKTLNKEDFTYFQKKVKWPENDEIFSIQGIRRRLDSLKIPFEESTNKRELMDKLVTVVDFTNTKQTMKNISKGKRCSYCLKDNGKLKMCSRCRKTYYDNFCQRKDWENHKPICKKRN